MRLFRCSCVSIAVWIWQLFSRHLRFWFTLCSKTTSWFSSHSRFPPIFCEGSTPLPGTKVCILCCCMTNYPSTQECISKWLFQFGERSGGVTQLSGSGSGSLTRLQASCQLDLQLSEGLAGWGICFQDHFCGCLRPPFTQGCEYQEQESLGTSVVPALVNRPTLETWEC